MTLNFRTQNGKLLTTSNVIGKGGEGIVYALNETNDLVIKIYHSHFTADRQEKIEAMCRLADSTNQSIAFPKEPVFDKNGLFAGFVMSRAGKQKPIHELYSPTSRKTHFPSATLPFLLRVGANIARSVATVHRSGCVIGDINHSGILVSNDATITLIDTDSFQVSYAGKVYLCKVGVPEFTPPELQGVKLSSIPRTINHDLFGLAILVFSLIFMGRHPFSGRYLGAGNPPTLPQAIAQHRFAYSRQRSVTEMDPPPNVPTLSDVPAELANAFETAFSQHGNLKGRPSAESWIKILDDAEKVLVACNRVQSHHYFSDSKDCPWCRMERAFPGFFAFPVGYQKPIISGNIDFGQLLQILTAIPDPGTAPDPTIAPSLASQSITVSNSSPFDLISHYWTSFAGTLIGLGWLYWSAYWNMLGLGLALAAIRYAFESPHALAQADQEYKAARDAWSSQLAGWTQAAGNQPFLAAKARAETLIRELKQLPSLEAKRLSELDSKRRDSQLRQFKESFLIEKAGIKGIGNARKITLRSYGIETAADVDGQRIMQIPGFGQKTVDSLLNWSHSIESRFVFNPSVPVDPAEILSVKREFTKRTLDTERDAKAAIALAQKASAEAFALREAPQALSPYWASLKSAEAKRNRLNERRNRVIGALIAICVAFVSAEHYWIKPGKHGDTSVVSGQEPTGYTTKAPIPQPLEHAPLTKEAQPISPGSATDSPAVLEKSPVQESLLPRPTPDQKSEQQNLPAENVGIPGAVTVLQPDPIQHNSQSANSGELHQSPQEDRTTTQTESEKPLDLLRQDFAIRVQQKLIDLGYLEGVADGVWGARSRFALRSFKAANWLGDDDAWNISVQERLFSGTPTAAREATYFPSDSTPTFLFAPPLGASRNPLNVRDALWIQGRLNELGYYFTPEGDGSWGAASRLALRNFRVANDLPNNDDWDAAVETILASANAIPASKTFLGDWALTPDYCQGRAIHIDAMEALNEMGRCKFNTFNRSGSWWIAKATCSVNGRNWNANIRLTVKHTQLVWQSEKGRTIYFRCPAP